MKKYQKSLIQIVLLVGITLLVLYFALKDDYLNIINQLKSVHIGWLLCAFILVILYWILRSGAINIFTRKFMPKTRYLSSFQLMLRTQFFNAVTPFATGGQPYQLYHLVKEGINVTSATSVILQNFIVYQIAIVFLGAVAVIANHAFSLYAKNMLLGRLVTLGFIINTLVIVILFIVAFSKKLNKVLIRIGITVLTKLKIVKNKEKKLEEWDEYINKFHHSAVLLLENKWEFLGTILLNVLALCFLYSIPLVLLFSTSDYTSFGLFEAIVTSAYVMLIGSFVPIPGGSGGLEFGFVSFYANFITGPKLMAIMLLWRFVTYYFGMIVGAITLNLRMVKS